MSDGIVSALELWQRLHAPPEAPWYLLDVRNEDEFARWPVEGARTPRTVNVPYFAFIDDPGRALALLPHDAGEAVVLCAKGDSSEFVRDQLAEAGLPAVHVGGGVLAWGTLHVPMRIASDGELEIWQVSRYGKGCLSYLVASGGAAVVVDPSRFVGVYEELARKLDVRIVRVVDTHVHADHLSGAAELSRRSGAHHRSPTAADAEAVIPLGRIHDAVRVLRTPGHTPESRCFLLSSGHLLTGDTLFARGVGRPDLGGELDGWGRLLHRSLVETLAALPDDTVVLPGHFGSAREAREDGSVTARLGDLRATLPELSDRDATAFVARIAAGVRPPPPEYEHIVKANRALADPGDAADEWELGRNECAAAARAGRSAAPLATSGDHDRESAHA